MRSLYTLLLSICCFAVALQTQAAGIPVKKTGAATECQASGQTGPNDALNNFHQLTTSGTAAVNHTFPKATSLYFSNSIYNKRTVAIFSDDFQTIPAFPNGLHAKTFLLKLIFPQHYHW